MDGIINIYKEKGYTSHDVAAIVKKCFKGNKVGHAGTLDPDAEGVLIILVGKATKLSDYIMADEKEYRAEVTFGITTDTYDGSGTILSVKEAKFTLDDLKNTLDSFIGEQMQVPPMYSAVKINGKKLYELARQGKEVERKARKIEISNIYLENYANNRAVIDIKCSKGTYVRTICYDIGEKLGCGAHMSALVRTRTGDFSSENGIKINRLKELAGSTEENALKDVLIPIDAALAKFPCAIVKNEANNALYNGGAIDVKYLRNPIPDNVGAVVLFDEATTLIGIYSVINTGQAVRLKPKTMLF